MNVGIIQAHSLTKKNKENMKKKIEERGFSKTETSSKRLRESGACLEPRGGKYNHSQLFISKK